jgi:hypothetical protein
MKQGVCFSEAWDLTREKKVYDKEPGSSQISSFNYAFFLSSLSLDKALFCFSCVLGKSKV